MDATNLSKHVSELATPHKVLNSQDVSRAAKLCEVVKHYLTNKAKSMVASASGRAVLYSYGSDGTPMLTRASFSSTLGGHTVRRYAGKSVEFLVERGFVKTTDGVGEPIVASLSRDPVPLLHGKTSWHIFPPACAFFPLLQRLGHRGIAVSHYCFDRAIYEPMMVKLRQRHAMFHALQRQNPASEWSPVDECLDWVLGTPCANHDCQNGLKWSLKAVLDDLDPAQVVHSLHIAIASVRNGFDLLHAHLGAFVAGAIDFWENNQETPEEDTIYQFWLCIGVDAEIAQILAELNLFWSGGKLRVAKGRRDDPMLLEKVTHCILHVCRFKQFTDSRWITMGESSRSLLAAMCLGLQGWVQYTRKDPRASDYYLHGFSHLQPNVLLYCAVAALASPVCDAVLMELLHDDRLAKRAGDIKEAMGSEIQWIADIGDFSWERVASVLGGASTPAKLRHRTVVAAGTIGAFLHKRFLSASLSYPWCLASGDIFANLERLAAEEEPVDPTAAKIHRLLRLGYNRHALVQGVERMADARWTTTAQEQGHGSGAAMRKAHSTYSQETLAVRAMLHMVRPLFQEPSLDPKLSQAEQKIARLEKKSPNKVSARQAFFAELVAAAKEGAKRAGPLARSWYQDLMRKHGQLFQALSRADKEVYEAKALSMRRVSEEAVQEEVAYTVAQQRLIKQRLSDEAVQKNQMLLMSSCRLSQADFEAIAIMFNSASFSKAAVAAMREKAQTAPFPPSSQLQGQLAAFSGESQGRDAPTAEWAKDVCRHRENFKGCAIVSGNGAGQTAFLFLMAMQRPFWAAFVPMAPVHHALPVLPTPSPSFSQGLSELPPDFGFEASIGEVVFDSGVRVESLADLYVLPHCLVLEGGKVVSNGSLHPFAEFVDSLGPPPAPPKQQGAAPENEAENPAPATSNPKLEVSFAWLRHYATEDRQEPEGSVSEPSASSSSPPPKQPSYLTEEDMNEAFALLEAKRAEWKQELASSPENFKTSISGGAWSMASKGLAADSVKAAASGSVAKDWCKRYGLPQATTFSYRKYTEKVATALALHWCQRLQYFFDLSRDLPEGCTFTKGDVQGAPDVEDVSKLLEDVVRTSPAWQRWEQKVAEIRALAPKSPKGKRGSGAASSSGR